MFERYTDRARRVVVLAQEESRLAKHNYIGTEHLLLGMVAEDEGMAAKVLKGAGWSVETLRAELMKRIGEGKATPQGHIPFTPRCRKVLELTFREALQLGHAYIGTEHQLLGLLREGEGMAAQMLGPENLQSLRQATLQMMQETRQNETVPPVGAMWSTAATFSTAATHLFEAVPCPVCGQGTIYRMALGTTGMLDDNDA